MKIAYSIKETVHIQLTDGLIKCDYNIVEVHTNKCVATFYDKDLAEEYLMMLQLLTAFGSSLNDDSVKYNDATSIRLRGSIAQLSVNLHTL